MSENIRREIVDLYGEDLVFLDGYDESVVGVVERFGMPSILCYSRSGIIKTLVDRDGMLIDEAYEYFIYNILGSYVGEYTPCYLEEIK